MAAGAQLTPGPAAPGWYPDPLERFEWRWWDGVRWTAGVSAGGRIQEDPLPAPSPSRRRVTTWIAVLVAAVLAAVVVVVAVVAVVAVVGWLGDQEVHVSTLAVRTVVHRLDQAGMPCELQGRPMSGAGGLPFPADNDYFEFGRCRLDNGELLAIVTFHPDARPGRPPCERVERTISGNAAWWIHQQSDEDASGGLDEPQQPDAATLRSVATALGGRYIDTC